jgi:hypothetical protein
LEANRGAVQIALNLGFEHYARHVAVRLKRESPSNPPLQLTAKLPPFGRSPDRS